MKINNKNTQLGMDHGTAQNQLKKLLFFKMAQKLELDICCRCGEKILESSDLSIDHIIPFLHSKDPKGLFFDLDNIGFSHMKCNRKMARRDKKHPSLSAYFRGCRCDECKKIKASIDKRYRERRYKKRHCGLE